MAIQLQASGEVHALNLRQMRAQITPITAVIILVQVTNALRVLLIDLNQPLGGKVAKARQPALLVAHYPTPLCLEQPIARMNEPVMAALLAFRVQEHARVRVESSPVREVVLNKWQLEMYALLLDAYLGFRKMWFLYFSCSHFSI